MSDYDIAQMTYAAQSPSVTGMAKASQQANQTISERVERAIGMAEQIAGTLGKIADGVSGPTPDLGLVGSGEPNQLAPTLSSQIDNLFRVISRISRHADRLNASI